MVQLTNIGRTGARQRFCRDGRDSKRDIGQLLFAVLLLPFFGFNYWFHYEVPVLTSIGMLDFAGNIIMLACAIIGWRAARAQEQA